MYKVGVKLERGRSFVLRCCPRSKVSHQGPDESNECRLFLCSSSLQSWRFWLDWQCSGAATPCTHSGQCSFNGVQERCVVEWDTDGTLIVTYLSDGKQVYYHTGTGRVTDGNREYIGAVSNRGSYYIFTTQNGQTMIPAY